ncbi:hypothetical protein SEA_BEATUSCOMEDENTI_67 [Arthrobacter phage BeatusComedenti]|uniref:Uncharacterized protein n=1 Tax=Arthrobacter phage BeatusComedenti TaxID=2656523 RepID=A0A649VVH9_9CAUD|nr:hypothetical protein SEA_BEATUSCOMEDENTI_67 [Arthrobacter phage BeatusComedenti]
MALVEVHWTITSTHVKQFEIYGYLEGVHVEEQVQNQLDDLSSEELDACETSTHREVDDRQTTVIRENDLTPEVKHAKKHEDMF